MSYTHNPKWTDTVELMGNSIVCPEFRRVPENKDEVLEIIFDHVCYEPRHIPPKLIFTCFNGECQNCDGDIVFNLRVNVLLEAV